MRELSIAYTHTPEPPPTGDGAIVLDKAISLISNMAGDNPWLVDALNKRASMGKEKYGDYLRTNNGRNAMVDFLQEMLDGLMYAVQSHMENPTSRERFELIDDVIDLAIRASYEIKRGE